MAGSLSGYAGPQQPGAAGRVPVPPPGAGARAGHRLPAERHLPRVGDRPRAAPHPRRPPGPGRQPHPRGLPRLPRRALDPAPLPARPAGDCRVAGRRCRVAGCSRSTGSTTRPAGLTLAIVGDVEPDDGHPPALVVAPRRRAAEGCAAAADRRAARAGAARDRALSWPGSRPTWCVGFPGATLSSPDRFRLELLAQVLSGQGGRLFVEIREKRALAYRVSAFSLEGLDPGYFAVYVSTSPDQVEEVSTQRSPRAAQAVGGVERGHRPGGARAGPALPGRHPCHRAATQERDRRCARLQRGLRPGLAGLPAVRRSDPRGRACRAPSRRSELSAARKGGGRDRPASRGPPTRRETLAQAGRRPPQIRPTSMSPRIDQSRNLLTNLILIFPLLIIYQLGVLVTYPMLNGADFVSGLLFGQLGFTQPAVPAVRGGGDGGRSWSRWSPCAGGTSRSRPGSSSHRAREHDLRADDGLADRPRHDQGLRHLAAACRRRSSSRASSPGW